MRVLIVEPDRAVRELLELQVGFLGHEVAVNAGESDVAVVEPATPEGIAAARVLHAFHPDVLMVFVSIRFPTPQTTELTPFAHLVKPFGLRRLASVLEAAAEMGLAACR
jgi:hypothetical protein